MVLLLFLRKNIDRVRRAVTVVAEFVIAVDCPSWLSSAPGLGRWVRGRGRRLRVFVAGVEYALVLQSSALWLLSARRRSRVCILKRDWFIPVPKVHGCSMQNGLLGFCC